MVARIPTLAFPGTVIIGVPWLDKDVKQICLKKSILDHQITFRMILFSSFNVIFFFTVLTGPSLAPEWHKATDDSGQLKT